MTTAVETVDPVDTVETGWNLSFTDVLANESGSEGPSKNETAADKYDSCQGYVPLNTLLLYLSAASAAFIIAGSFWRRRMRLWPKYCAGRPALLQPLDTLDTRHNHRVSYAAAFGLTAQICLNIFGGDAIPKEFGAIDPRTSAVFNIICVIIYGIALYPLFGALYVEHWAAYGVALLYVCLLLSVDVANIVYCAQEFLATSATMNTPNDTEWNAEFFKKMSPLVSIQVSKSIPILLCEITLFGLMAWQLVSAARQLCVKMLKVNHHTTTVTASGGSKAKNACYEQNPCYLHVKALLARQAPVEVKHVSLKDRLRALFYQPVPGYRYPMRVISTFVVALILVYMTAFELTQSVVVAFKTIDIVVDRVRAVVDFTDGDYQSLIDNLLGEYSIILKLLNADRLERLLALYDVVKSSFYVAQALALFTSILMMALAFVAFRNDMRAVYRGDYSKVPRASVTANRSLMMSSLHYSGFQIAYILWGYLIHFLFLFIICVVIGTLIVLSVLFQFILYLLQRIWPGIIITVVLFILQGLVGRFAFLRDGKLALNNRRFYFNLLYFMFFYNILLGFVSCLLRILKGTIIGISFLSRLDQCAMARNYESLDPGFNAYVGFVHVENAHTNPTLNVFCHFLSDAVSAHRDDDGEIGCKTVTASTRTSEWKRTRNRLLVALLLSKHPQLVIQRKRYLASKQKRSAEASEPSVTNRSGSYASANDADADDDDSTVNKAIFDATGNGSSHVALPVYRELPPITRGHAVHTAVLSELRRAVDVPRGGCDPHPMTTSH